MNAGGIIAIIVGIIVVIVGITLTILYFTNTYPFCNDISEKCEKSEECCGGDNSDCINEKCCGLKDNSCTKDAECCSSLVCSGKECVEDTNIYTCGNNFTKTCNDTQDAKPDDTKCSSEECTVSECCKNKSDGGEDNEPCSLGMAPGNDCGALTDKPSCERSWMGLMTGMPPWGMPFFAGLPKKECKWTDSKCKGDVGDPLSTTSSCPSPNTFTACTPGINSCGGRGGGSPCPAWKICPPSSV